MLVGAERHLFGIGFAVADHVGPVRNMDIHRIKWFIVKPVETEVVTFLDILQGAAQM